MKVSSILCSIATLMAMQHGFSDNNDVELSKKTIPIGGYISLGVDDFRSLPNGSYSDENGIVAGINLAYQFSCLPDLFSVQLGGSYGAYDWTGKSSLLNGEFQQQGFLTAGLFRLTSSETSGVNVAVLYDLMFNDNFGVFGLNPFLQQVRAQIGYVYKKSNEIGLWGTCSTSTSDKYDGGAPVSFRAISQLNVFWSHYYKNEAQTMTWVGMPYREGLMFGSKLPGLFIAGFSFKTPLACHFSFDGHASYMLGREFQEGSRPFNNSFNVFVALTYAFGGSKPGEKPYMPIADNSRFIVDTTSNQ